MIKAHSRKQKPSLKKDKAEAKGSDYSISAM